jgi:hypothetical protein
MLTTLDAARFASANKSIVLPIASGCAVTSALNARSNVP